jgi:hypothetical protein
MTDEAMVRHNNLLIGARVRVKSAQTSSGNSLLGPVHVSESGEMLSQFCPVDWCSWTVSWAPWAETPYTSIKDCARSFVSVPYQERLRTDAWFMRRSIPRRRVSFVAQQQLLTEDASCQQFQRFDHTHTEDAIMQSVACSSTRKCSARVKQATQKQQLLCCHSASHVSCTTWKRHKHRHTIWLGGRRGRGKERRGGLLVRGGDIGHGGLASGAWFECGENDGGIWLGSWSRGHVGYDAGAAFMEPNVEAEEVSSAAWLPNERTRRLLPRLYVWHRSLMDRKGEICSPAAANLFNIYGARETYC